MTKETIQDLERYLEKYESYLNDGQWKPQWRIEEVTSFIKIAKGILNGTN